MRILYEYEYEYEFDYEYEYEFDYEYEYEYDMSLSWIWSLSLWSENFSSMNLFHTMILMIVCHETLRNTHQLPSGYD